MRTQYFLASANTCYGFKNCFDFINPSDNAHIFILKGGPGTGKSTFMQAIGEYFENKGYHIEYFFCSSDKDSLDGVRIVEKDISIVDGTAPHVTEASIPGVKEEIINLGAFINKDIKIFKSKIEKLLSKKSKQFLVAYEYLASVNHLIKIEEQLAQTNTNCDQFEKIISTINTPIKTGSQRKLFLNYFGENGLESLVEKNNFKNITRLQGDNYFTNQNILQKLAQFLIKNKIKHTIFLSLFNQNYIEAIFIDQNSTLYLNDICNFKNQKTISLLIKKASKSILKAKFYHKKVEKFYIQNMDFDGINKIRENLIEQIENY